MIHEWGTGPEREPTDEDLFCAVLDTCGVDYTIWPYFPAACFEPPLASDRGDANWHIDLVLVIDRDACVLIQHYFDSRKGTMLPEAP